MDINSTVSQILLPVQETYKYELKMAPIYLLVCHKLGLIEDYLKVKSNTDEVVFKGLIYDYISEAPEEIRQLEIKKDFLENSEANLHSNELDKIKYKIQKIYYSITILNSSEFKLENISDDLIKKFNNNINICGFEYSELLDGLIAHTYDSYDKENFQVPDELSDLLVYLANTNKDETIYNPFSGFNSISIKLQNYKNVITQEFDNSTYILGLIRILIAEKENIKSYRADSLSNIISEGVDCILTSPPLVGGLSEKTEGYRFIGSYLLDQYLELLANNKINRVVISLPRNILFEPSLKRIRKKMVDNSFLKYVINLPSHILKVGNLEDVIIMVLEREVDQVIFIDAQGCICKSDNYTYTNRIHLKSLKKIITSNKHNNKIYVNRLDISRQEYQLISGIYLQADRKGRPLGDLIGKVKTSKPEDKSYKYIIQIKDLKFREIVELEAFEDSVSTKGYKVLNRTSLNNIHGEVLFISKIGNTLKSAIYTFKGDEEILVIDNINIYEIKNENDVITGYINHELSKSYVQDQRKELGKGTSIPYIKDNDIEKIKINMIPRNDQIDLISSLESLNLELDYLNQKIQRTSENNQVSRSIEIGTIEHNTKTKLAASNLEIEDLIEFFSQDEKLIELVKVKFEDEFKIGIEATLENILNNNSEVMGLVSMRGLNLKDYPLVEIEVREISNLLKDFAKNEHRLNIEVDDTIDNRFISVIANTEILKLLLNNLLSNAKKHAFPSPKDTDKVVISLVEEDYRIRLTYADNGNGFIKGYDKNKFIKKYNTTNKDIGTGEGGFTIDQIGKYIYDHWNFNKNNNKDYNVIFDFFMSKVL